MIASYIVTKPFKTLTRRMSVGDEISAADCDGQMTADDWFDRGFLEPAPMPVIEPVAALPAPADDPPN